MAAATDAYTDPSDLAGFLKPVFGDLQWLLPEEALLQKTFPFSAANSVGKQFEEPLQVRTSWGVSFLGSEGEVQALTESSPSKTVAAEVKPFLTVLNDKISYTQFDRGNEGGKKAFMSTGAYVGKNLAMQLRRILEMSMVNGQQGIMEIETYSSAGTTSVVVTAASLRTGILALLEGAKLDILDAAGTTVIANGTAGGSQGVEVLSVDIDTRTIVFKAAPTLDGGGAVTPVAPQVLYLHGANLGTSVFKEMVGLRKQIGATTGTVFNINKATYQAVRGNVVGSIGPISAGALLKAGAKAINRGMQGRMVVLLSPLSWGELNSRNIAQQVFDSSYKPSKAEEGTDAILVRGNGVVMECLSYSYMADGEFMMLPKEGVKRIGSAYENSGPDGDTDISFMIPGSNLRFVDPVPGYNAVKVECRSDQAIYLQKPAWAVLGTGVTHT